MLFEATYSYIVGMPPQQPPPGVPPPGHPVVPPAPHVNPAFFPPQHGSGLPPPVSVLHSINDGLVFIVLTMVLRLYG